MKAKENVKKPNWRVLNTALKIASEIIEETEFNPSYKQQGTIWRLLWSQLKEMYERSGTKERGQADQGGDY